MGQTAADACIRRKLSHLLNPALERLLVVLDDCPLSSRARTEEETNAAIDQDYWNDPVVQVTPMTQLDAVEAMADFDNCIDIAAEGV